MEDSCAATPLHVLTGRDSKSPLQVFASSPESDGMKSPSGRLSPDSRCVICLGRLQNKSFTDSCLHQFCFQCLLQWSKVKPECPLCKQPFKSIIHNVRSNLDYDQYHVERREGPPFVVSPILGTYMGPVDRRFRYRSTMSREYFRALAESFARRFDVFDQDTQYQIPPTPPTRRSSRLHAGTLYTRLRQRGTTEFRRSIYNQDLWVQDLPDVSGRYRECSPQFYRENPAQVHRMVPWLNREVNVLLNDCSSHSAYVLQRILATLKEHSIRCREFREVVEPYFREHTDHFVHEFYTFARSVYDIAGFDQHATYVTNPNYATEVQELSSNSDSDIEIIETLNRDDGKTSRPSVIIMPIDRNDSGNNNNEPVAGPSGLNNPSASEPIEICESDPEDVKVLDYVKPEPEIVTLSSGDEAAPTNYSDVDLTNFEVFDNDRYNAIRDYIHSLSPLSSGEEFDPNRKEERKYKSTKGKCKSNGYGLKGKQKKKYIKLKRNRRSRSSSSSSSTSSLSSVSISSVTISSVDSIPSALSSSDFGSDYEPTPKLVKKGKDSLKSKSRKKSKKRGERRSLKDTVEKRKSSEDRKGKRIVKSCVVVPSSRKSKSHKDSRPHRESDRADVALSPSSKPSTSRLKIRKPFALASYWSLQSEERKQEKSRRKRSSSRSKKSKRRRSKSSERESVKSDCRDSSDEESANRIKYKRSHKKENGLCSSGRNDRVDTWKKKKRSNEETSTHATATAAATATVFDAPSSPDPSSRSSYIDVDDSGTSSYRRLSSSVKERSNSVSSSD